MKREVHRGWTPREIDVLSDGASPALLLDDPLQRQSITVPQVVDEPVGLGPTRIGWDATASHTISRGTRASPNLDDCLLFFIQLYDKSDKDIVRFAKRWGPLGICEHGKPYTHHPECLPLSAPERVWESDDENLIWMVNHLDSTSKRPWRRFWEPLTAWRFYSKHFGALLRVARVLAGGGRPSVREWFAAFPWQEACERDSLIAGEPYPPLERHTEWTEQNLLRLFAEDARGEREILTAWLNRLLRDARVMPRMKWHAGEANPLLTVSFGQAPALGLWADQLHLGTDSLFAVLTAQLVAFVQDPRRNLECSVCGGPVGREVKRRPKPGERILCWRQECQDDNARRLKRESAQRRRARERDLKSDAARSTPKTTPKPVYNGEQARTE
jgi:hypothetical protein